MGSDLLVRRKWTFRAHGRQVVFVKKRQESAEHVLMKAFLWALYVPIYPSLLVEVGIGTKYKPDLVAFANDPKPVFWGEAGKVSPAKIRTLVRRYPHTHFALAKWGERLDPHVRIVEKALAQASTRGQPFDLYSFPPDSHERFISSAGEITVFREALRWQRLP